MSSRQRNYYHTYEGDFPQMIINKFFPFREITVSFSELMDIVDWDDHHLLANFPLLVIKMWYDNAPLDSFICVGSRRDAHFLLNIRDAYRRHGMNEDLVSKMTALIRAICINLSHQRIGLDRDDEWEIAKYYDRRGQPIRYEIARLNFEAVLPLLERGVFYTRAWTNSRMPSCTRDLLRANDSAHNLAWQMGVNNRTMITKTVSAMQKEPKDDRRDDKNKDRKNQSRNDKNSFYRRLEGVPRDQCVDCGKTVPDRNWAAHKASGACKK